MRAGWIAWLLCCIASWPVACGATPARQFKLLTFDQPPYIQTNAHGEPEGAAVELVGAIFARMRIRPQLQIYPLARSLALFSHGYAGGIFTMKKTPGRQLQYAFPRQPLFTQQIVLFVRKDAAFSFSGDLRALSGRSIGLVRGASYGQRFDVAAGSRIFSRLDYASHDEWSFRKLIAGRVDAVVAGRQAGIAMLRRLRATGEVQISGPPLEVTESYIMFYKSAVDADFLQRFNAALSLMQKDGSASRIREKYGVQ